MSASSSLIDIKVPDIGDFDEVTVIEILVKVGDTIKIDQSLLTVESDKASMEIPASQAGVVKEIKVKLGDKVKQGSVVLSLEAAEGVATPGSDSIMPVAPQNNGQIAINKIATADSAVPASIPAAASFSGTADMDCDLVVLGAGPGG